MTTTLRKLVLVLLAITAGERMARADATNYAIFKVANYQQVDSTQPISLNSPDAYYFGAQLFANDYGEILTNASMTTPDSVVYPMSGNPVPTAYYYNSPYYPDKTSFDADYPNGTYEFDVNDGSDYGLLTIPDEDLYTASIPYFTGDTWCRLQAVDASRPLKLCWNSFIPNPDATSAFIFVRILDPFYNYAYTTNFIPADVTNICIPADSLNAGTTYTIQLLFSDRADDVNYGFNDAAPATSGFDVLTYTSLVTGPPKLCIEPGTNAAILSWSIAASNFGLESAGELSSATTWCPVTNAPTVVNNKNVLIVPTCHAARFFQLYELYQP
jgi:hypothetical protein